MAMETVNCEYEIRSINVGGTLYECIGSASAEFEQRTISKTCRGVTVKQQTRSAGYGTLTVSLHIDPNDVVALAGATTTSSVSGYGRNAPGEMFIAIKSLPDFYDGPEDDGIIYRLFPRCSLTSGPAFSVENGADEVAETELTFTFYQDNYGKCMYSTSDADIGGGWLELTVFDDSVTSSYQGDDEALYSFDY